VGPTWVYIATDLTPYLLSIAAAFPLAAPGSTPTERPLRSAPARYSSPRPIMGLVGDYFEVGGILVSDGLARVRTRPGLRRPEVR
jgi:hypothetical protein